MKGQVLIIRLIYLCLQMIIYNPFLAICEATRISQFDCTISTSRFSKCNRIETCLIQGFVKKYSRVTKSHDRNTVISTSQQECTCSLRRDSTSEITCVLKILNQKSKSMQKSDSIQPRSCLIHKKHVAELVRRRSKNLKFSEKIVGLVKITLNYIYTESRSIFSYSSYIPSVIVLTGP